jgi:hypothetical protein
MEGLIEGYATVMAIAPGLLLRMKDTTLQEGPCAIVDFHLFGGTRITFAVRNQRGRAVPNASAVGIAPEWDKMQPTEDGKSKFVLPPRALSDESGMLELTVPANKESFDCKIAAAGYQTRYIKIDVKKVPHDVVLEDPDQLILLCHKTTEATWILDTRAP